MLFLVSNARYPVKYVSCGNLINQYNFIHPKRNLDSFVLIIGQTGVLHINQDGRNYDVGPNQFLILFANHDHYGYKSSDERLSYYWVHFYIDDADYKYYHQSSLKRHINLWDVNPEEPFSSDHYILPEYGELSLQKRSNLLFVQLMDLSRRDSYAYSYRCCYALSLLLLEISQESLTLPAYLNQNIPTVVITVIEWIRTNYDQALTVKDISSQFSYNATYLSSLFKEHTGYSLSKYINRTRISISKNLLTNRILTISFIAEKCGFNDEKYFMKLFKKIEGLTPSQYRDAFHEKKINKK